MSLLDRRALLRLAGIAGASAAIPVTPALAQGAGSVPEGPLVNVRTWSAGSAGVYRNIHALETETGLVVVDAPLRKSDGAAAREWLLSLQKPVKAVLMTHTHPDHNFGLTEMLQGQSAQVVATRAVADAIRAGEAAFQRFVPNFIGDAETERDRRFPDTTVGDRETFTIDGVPFQARDLGEAESAADSIWTTAALPNALFSGDLVFHRVHTWVAQGATGRYLSVLERLQGEVDRTALFFAGHGGIAPASAIPRQIAYLQTFRAAVRELSSGRTTLTEAQKQELVRRMTVMEPSAMLAFGIATGADAVARELSGG